jgi:hypothetical protein
MFHRCGRKEYRRKQNRTPELKLSKVIGKKSKFRIPLGTDLLTDVIIALTNTLTMRRTTGIEPLTCYRLEHHFGTSTNYSTRTDVPQDRMRTSAC